MATCFVISAVLAADWVASCSSSGLVVANAFSIVGGIGEYFGVLPEGGVDHGDRDVGREDDHALHDSQIHFMNICGLGGCSDYDEKTPAWREISWGLPVPRILGRKGAVGSCRNWGAGLLLSAKQLFFTAICPLEGEADRSEFELRLRGLD